METMSTSKSNFGILDLEFYTPLLYVDQRELEKFDDASEGFSNLYIF